MCQALEVAESGYYAWLKHHSGRGSHYTNRGYQAILADQGIELSMNRKGNCLDNAPLNLVGITLKLSGLSPYRQGPQSNPLFLKYGNTSS